MEKKGDPLNQLAIISDLIENLNFKIKSNILIFDLSEDEFQRIFNLIQNKYEKKLTSPDSTFKITIGAVEIIFNKNSV